MGCSHSLVLEWLSIQLLSISMIHIVPVSNILPTIVQAHNGVYCTMHTHSSLSAQGLPPVSPHETVAPVGRLLTKPPLLILLLGWTSWSTSPYNPTLYLLPWHPIQDKQLLVDSKSCDISLLDKMSHAPDQNWVFSEIESKVAADCWWLWGCYFSKVWVYITSILIEFNLWSFFRSNSPLKWPHFLVQHTWYLTSVLRGYQHVIITWQLSICIPRTCINVALCFIFRQPNHP